jgi:SAM-dependent methyltransferase
MSNDQRTINTLYSNRVSVHGRAPEGLGWGPKDRRHLRFNVLSKQWNLTGSRVLDFGCGFGDLAGFFDSSGIACEYTGADINPDVLDIARQKHPQAQFFCLDILNDELPGRFDFVLSSGVFNDRRDDAKEFRCDVLKKLDAYSVKGFAANFLSTQAAIRYEDANYNEPAEVLSECYKYSNNIVLKNDYMPYEFSIFVNKFSEVDQERTIYREYLALDDGPGF